MVKSMTGYGRARETRNGRDITVEVRSVNNRYLDCTVKMPRAYIFAEDAVKAAVQRAVSRGKVDVFISVDSLGAEETVVSVNEPLARAYVAALARLAGAGGHDGCEGRPIPATDLARLPDVLTVTKAEEDLEGPLRRHLRGCSRRPLCGPTAPCAPTEGEALAADILGRPGHHRGHHRPGGGPLPPDGGGVPGEAALARMQEVLQTATVDEARILTEAAIFADKVAVDEETVRLRSHLAQLREMLRGDDARGPEAGFPHPGGQPGVQHHRLQVQRPAPSPGTWWT